MAALDTDVVVVGAGPVGLLLACELRTGGARVTVLERLERPTAESRASTLHARTMELFAERGLLAELGPPSRGGPGHFGGLPLELAEADPGHPFAGQWKAPQTRVEAVLGERAVRLGAEVWRGVLVTGLEQGPQAVTARAIGPERAPFAVTARYAVGCDGEDSTVRRLAGFDFPGTPATRELLRADVAGVDIPGRRFERHPNGLAIASRWPDGSTRVMLHEYGSVPRRRTGPPEFPEVAAAWRRITGEDIGGGTPLWLNAFGNALRQAARYRRGRVLLAGDAAHVQLPVGGQSLNLGLQDAADLGPKLAAQCAGPTDEALLDSYHEVRHSAGRRALAHIDAQAQLLLGGPEVEPLRATVAELMEHAPVRRHLARTISGLAPPIEKGSRDR
ncbi:FAD-dependent monooxygenase [Streptomyces boncukensis]|uniref:NAD-binding protein n=1 Tax=Streptomyces boncukensis TaxID=2711219 RepID=A0A6G4WUI0_9ACTN|nr:NAD-binding protein [Streptomyces boncukensis]